MKNLNIALVIAIVLALILCGCSGKNVNNNTDTTNTDEIVVDSNREDTEESATTETLVEILEEKAEVNMEMFTEVEPTSDNLNFYRSDIIRRQAMETFLPEKEKEVLREAGYVVFDDHLVSPSGSDLYYPVVYRYQQGLFLWTTSSYGSISFKMVYGSCSNFFSNYGGELHFFKNLDGCSEEEIEIIRETSEFSLTFDPVKGEVKRWEFGKVVGQYAVPQESVYCGFAFFDGFIFRQGTDVFALNWVNVSDRDMKTVPIAHGVKYVLMTEYRQNSDAWSSPLFIMEDGEIMAYVGWDSYGETPDDPGHLVPPEFEGGYH